MSDTYDSPQDLQLDPVISPNPEISQSRHKSTESSVSRPIWSESQRQLLFKKDKIALITTRPLARYVPCPQHNDEC